MRETRLLSFAPDVAANSAQTVHISVPTATPTTPAAPPRRRWAGVVGGVLSWRTCSAGTSILFEHAVTGNLLRVTFSSALSARPLLRPHAPESGGQQQQQQQQQQQNPVPLLSVQLLCDAHADSTTFVHLHVSQSLLSTPGSPAVVEVARTFLSGLRVTCAAPALPPLGGAGDFVAGLADGRVQLIPADGSAPPPPIASARQQAARSVRALPRFFAAAAPAPTADPVVAVCPLPAPPRVIALHQSATVVTYAVRAGTLAPSAEVALPVSLSLAGPHYLTALHQKAHHAPAASSSSTASPACVVVARCDEDPAPDSLRVFHLTCSTTDAAPTVVQVADRPGPVPLVVGVAPLAQRSALLIATDDASVWPVACPHAAPHQPPAPFVWPVTADLSAQYGINAAMEVALPSRRARLQRAHIIPPAALVRALRLPSEASRADVAEELARLAGVEGEELDPAAGNRSRSREDLPDGHPLASSDGMAIEEQNEIENEDAIRKLDRALKRAEEASMSSEFRLLDLSLSADGDNVLGGAPVVARADGIFVLRRLSSCERFAADVDDELIVDPPGEVRGDAAWLIAAHAAAQELGAKLLADARRGHGTEHWQFSLREATAYSEKSPDKPLTTVLARNALNLGKKASHAEATAMLVETLQPGTAILATLYRCDELEALERAADMSLNLVQISSSLATGIVLLEQHRRETMSEANLPVGAEGVARRRSRGRYSGRMLPSETLDKAYGMLVHAAQLCYEGTSRREFDVACALDMAGVCGSHGSQELVFAPSQAGNRQSIGSDPADVPIMTDGQGAEKPLLEDAGFWLLERAVRKLEKSAYPSRAAAAALEAMNYAPDARRHEMMRATAFNRFLDAGELDFALKALMNEPYRPDGTDETPEVTPQDAVALRDAIGLFVDAVADHGKLSWLSKEVLPEPLRTLCGQALLRRARASVPFRIAPRLPRGESQLTQTTDAEAELAALVEAERQPSEYEQLYGWLVGAGDHAGAAAAALEWGERLAADGLGPIRDLQSHSLYGGVLKAGMFVSLLLNWARTKCDAYTCALAATQLLPTDSRTVARTRYSLVADERGEDACPVVDVPWVARRHLLAHAQMRMLLGKLRSVIAELSTLKKVQHLAADGSFLSEDVAGVRYVASMLASPADNLDNIHLAAQLCAAWRDEPFVASQSNGSGVSTSTSTSSSSLGGLHDVIRSAASAAARRESEFDFNELASLLETARESEEATTSTAKPSNWALVALDGALAASATAAPVPQWLVDAAAWGDAGPAKAFRGCSNGGDVGGVVRALLRAYRPVDAADVLLAGFDGMDATTGMENGGGSGIRRRRGGDATASSRVCVAYTAVEATMDALTQIAVEFPAAADRQVRLGAAVRHHLDVAREQAEALGQVERAGRASDGMALAFGAPRDVEMRAN